MSRDYSFLDHCLIAAQEALTTLCGKPGNADRANPAWPELDESLSSNERSVSVGLMRINHTGEVCAQALYRGQACVAKDEEILAFLKQAEREENDHFLWCHERLDELGAKCSVFNAYWYWHSFFLGIFAGLIGDHWSLGFVVETEKQVADHLRDHQARLPKQDKRSKAIIDQMLIDEEHHGHSAEKLGAKELPDLIKVMMHCHAQVMKAIVYHV